MPNSSLETAVSLRPEAFEALAVSGSVLFALGDDGAALPRLRHAHELRPGEPKMKHLLIEELKISARHATTEKDYDQAIALWEEALRLEPGSAELRGAIAEAEHEKALARDTGRRP